MKKGNPILKIRNTISTFLDLSCCMQSFSFFSFRLLFCKSEIYLFPNFIFYFFQFTKNNGVRTIGLSKLREISYFHVFSKKKKKAAIKLEWKKEGIKFNGLPHKNILMKKSPSFLTPAVVPLRVSDKILWHLKRTAYTKSSFLPLNYYLIIMP